MSVKQKNGRPLMVEGKKTKHIKARVTEDEYTMVTNEWESLSMKESDYLRLMVLKPGSLKVKVNAQEVIRLLDQLGAELGRSGNNINQLARHANFLNKRGMLNAEIVVKFNDLFSEYISLFREIEKETRALLRRLKS
ncbi:plasmid mobilization protein [Pedobacter endophyticus]|uniref:Plasmid mobilization relaxosome protein MobC n=1 Tax=Pedobacter endophyticus TaxID=2789740 RepID=A0A7U3SPI6_9SPHI|nr:plasmid mobilization relaxosome protein MobC [Pedobacter endophyticus]QPH38658.1 plasmid mobilization relaxosome protein MobC [Pedobacter endophyticus]